MEVRVTLLIQKNSHPGITRPVSTITILTPSSASKCARCHPTINFLVMIEKGKKVVDSISFCRKYWDLMDTDQPSGSPDTTSQ